MRLAAAPGPGAAAARLRRRRTRRSRRDALPALEHRLELAGGLVPVAARVAHVGALRAADAAETALHDRQVPPRRDHALEAAAALGLVVVVPLLVAVVDLGDRGIAPVDDRDAAALDEAALADEDVALAAIGGRRRRVA